MPPSRNNKFAKPNQARPSGDENDKSWVTALQSNLQPARASRTQSVLMVSAIAEKIKNKILDKLDEVLETEDCGAKKNLLQCIRIATFFHSSSPACFLHVILW